MRQIHIGAWLWLSALAGTACSGGEFSTGETRSGGPATAAAGTAPGSSKPDDSPEGRGGSNGLGAGGRAQGGRASSGGTSTSSVGGATSVGGAANGGAPLSGVSGSEAEENSAGSRPAPPTNVGVAADCATGSVTIRMRPGSNLPTDFLCDASCGTGWLTITDAEGATAFSISSACGTATCDTCEVQACGAAACLPTPLRGSGSELVWTGTYLAKDTCGDYTACQRQACVKPGRYKARACAALNDGESEHGCMPKEPQLCAEAEFEFPSKEDVVLVLEQ